MSSQVHILDSDSPPRVMFSGEQLLIEHLPAGTRVLYPKPPIVGLKDPDAAIRYALNHPLGMDPLHALLFPGMKVTIAFDDIHLIAALAVHRRMTPDELRHAVGDKIYNAFAPDRLYNHDAEDLDNMVELGRTDKDELVQISRRAAESDLVIYCNLNLVPMDGGHKSIATGLTGYKALRANHNPYVMRKCDSYMDPDEARSPLHASINRQGKLAEQHVKVFHIETAINNRMFEGQLDFFMKKEEAFSDFDWQKARGLKATLDRLPQQARQAMFYAAPAAYELIGVWAGEVEQVHAQTVKKCFEQYLVPVKGQADIAIFGVPYVCPYNVHSYLNPLLVQVQAQGYLHNLYKGAPLLKKGGTAIITHPMEDKFDPVHHAPYIEFVHRLLPETRDAMVLHKKYEQKFAEDPIYVELYRKSHAYHGSHPFFMWYWGENGRQHIGRVIVAGAKDPYICELFGYEPAANLQEAIAMAQDTAPRSPQITMVHVPPIMMVDVTTDTPTTSTAATLPGPKGAQ